MVMWHAVRQTRGGMARVKVFLDTNIIIDALCNREAGEEAQIVLDMGVRGEITLFCTSLTIANCIYNCRKSLGKDVVTVIMKKLCSFIHVSPLTQQETDLAFSLQAIDFEDALQYSSALAINADVILTRNAKHFDYSDIKVMDCQSFLETSHIA